MRKAAAKKKSLQLIDPQAFLNDASKANLLRLMVAFDTMRAVYRWMVRLIKDGNEIEKQDMLIALVTGSGWTCESVKLLKEGNSKGWLDRKMLARQKDHQRLWDEFMQKNRSERLKRLYNIRNKCFGHFDKELVNQFRKRKFGPGELPPFIVSIEDGSFLGTRYPWAYAIQAIFLWPSPFDPKVAAQRVSDIRELVFKTTELMSELIRSLIAQDKSLRCVAIPDDDSGVSRSGESQN